MTDNTKATEELWDILKDSRTCMVTTEDNGVLRARPMAPTLDDETRQIHFLTKRTAAKVEELHHERNVCLTFCDNDDITFASVSGRGTVTTNRELIDKLWSPMAGMWFDGDKDTADVAVISVNPEQAEYWTNDDGKIKTAWEFGKGYLTGSKPDIGENEKVSL